MFQVIPMWEVVTDPDSTTLRQVWRVPESDLEAFFRVLRFSGIEDWRVMREDEQAGPKSEEER